MIEIPCTVEVLGKNLVLFATMTEAMVDSSESIILPPAPANNVSHHQLLHLISTAIKHVWKFVSDAKN